MLTIDSVYKFIAKDYKETLIFCVFSAIAIIIPVIGALLLMGLSIRVISNSINKKDEIPKFFGNFEEDLINGLKYMLFGFVLSIPFIIIFAGSFSNMFAAILTEDYSVFTNFASNLGFLWILMIVLCLTYMFIVPALTANFAKEKKFSAFFELNKAFNMVFSNFEAFLKMIGLNIIYSFIFSIISGILSFTIIVPFLISPLMILTSGKIMGDWYNEVNKK
jgi:hypothetical protein